jgi:hypothetical protein
LDAVDCFVTIDNHRSVDATSSSLCNIEIEEIEEIEEISQASVLHKIHPHHPIPPPNLPDRLPG